MTSDERSARLFALRTAAETIANPLAPLGRRARSEFLETTQLSEEGIEYGLSECLETRTGRAALTQLTRRAPPANASHVLLSANVFVGAFRAIALALAQTPRVFVRASRREPSMARLLWEASGEAFELVDELAPTPGEHLWAYGSDETIDSLRETLPPGVRFHGHGSGMGAVVVREPKQLHEAELRAAFDALAQDTLAFDQRGCLSPRIVVVEGSREFTNTLARGIAQALRSWQSAVPRGRLSKDEAADAERFEATCTYVGETHSAGAGLVFVDPRDDRLVVPPVGRYLHVVRTDDALSLLTPMGARLTTIGFWHAEQLPGQFRDAIGDRRYVELGQMQRPALDGPVDLRHGWSAELL